MTNQETRINRINSDQYINKLKNQYDRISWINDGKNLDTYIFYGCLIVFIFTFIVSFSIFNFHMFDQLIPMIETLVWFSIGCVLWSYFLFSISDKAEQLEIKINKILELK